MTHVTLNGVLLFEYTYNANNRLVKVEGGNSNTIAEYYYDPFGRRLWKDVGGTRTYFFYSDEGLVAEYDAGGNELKSYGYKPDATWTTDPLFLRQDSAYYFYQNDHLGTPQKLIAQNGAVVWSATYSAFGQANVEIETVTNNLRFPGQYEDDETGLHYNRFRYYAPTIGRYLKSDLIESINAYTYVTNNPVIWVDPVGLAKIFIDLGHGDITWRYKTTKDLKQERDPVTGRYTVLNETITRTIPASGGAYPHDIDISDCGTPGNFCEKDLVISIAPELKRRLEELGHKVVLSRTGDRGTYEEAERGRETKDREWQGIEWRLLMAADEAADYIVSVHVNKTTKNHNFQVYYYNGSPVAAIFAENIRVTVEEENLFDVCELKPTEYGVGEGEDSEAEPGDQDYIEDTLRMLWKAAHPELIASVLLEVGDIGVEQSREFWTDEEQKERFIERLVKGIDKGIAETEN